MKTVQLTAVEVHIIREALTRAIKSQLAMPHILYGNEPSIIKTEADRFDFLTKLKNLKSKL